MKKVFRKNNIIVQVFVVVIGILLMSWIWMEKRDTYYYPSSIPDGYSYVQPENDVIEGAFGIGFIVDVSNEKHRIRITTYKQPSKDKQLDMICGKEGLEGYSDIQVLMLNKKRICSYTYTNGSNISKKYYLILGNKLVSISENDEPFVTNEEIYKMISSLEVKRRS